jgi:hypothetical protein
LLELADKSVIIPAGSLDDVTVTLASWEYQVEFLEIHSKSSKHGHPVVFGQPWLATTDAFISCRSWEMTISNGTHNQKLILFPHACCNLGMHPFLSSLISLCVHEIFPLKLGQVSFPFVQ